MNNVLKVTLRCIGAYCIGVEHRLTLNQTLAGDRKHHRRGTKADVGGRFTLLVSCLCVRLCTTTPAEAEPASGTASFASNTWRPGTTSQRRWVCPSFGSVSASWLQLTLQHVQKVARTPDHFVWVTEAQLKGIYGMCCRWQCSHWYGHIAHLRLLSSLDLGDGGGGMIMTGLWSELFWDFLRSLTAHFPRRWTLNSKTTRWSPKERWVGQTRLQKKTLRLASDWSATDINFTFYDSGHAKGNANSL